MDRVDLTTEHSIKMRTMKNNKITNTNIDIVIPWVDGSDPDWIKEKNKYLGVVNKEDNIDARDNRYRDWGLLRYWFRGVEKFLPWIRTIHFVTWGHIPHWLNADNPKLHIVKHTDYIPEKYLPTFSANPIELNFHRINGLSENFIYANDDMYFTDYMDPEEVFYKGLPGDSAVQTVHQFIKGGIDGIVAKDLEVLNYHFDKKKCIKKSIGNWYNIKYGRKVFNNIYLMPFSNFTGFEDFHIPYFYNKSTFDEVWNVEFETLDKTCRRKFRTDSDVNQWLMRYWQLASNRFYPIKADRGKFFIIGKDDEKIKSAITRQEYKMICLSDDIEDINQDKEIDFLKKCFDKILPCASSYEIGV